MMVCEHLSELEQALINANAKETYRGQPWSRECREWVYFDCVLDLQAIRLRFDLPDCVVDHQHLGTHDGQESGLKCNQCQDAIMGLHLQTRSAAKKFPE